MFFLKAPNSRQINLALLALRVSTGLTMAAHGYQKVFTFGVEKISGGFAGMGIPMSSIAAPLVSYLELLGGILIAVGFLTRPLAVLLAFDMFVASTFVHLKNGFFAPTGAEFTLLLMVNFLALTITGAGSFSVDSVVDSTRRNAS
ncbi:MAG: DoxX family protein [Gemmatimonas sp.]